MTLLDERKRWLALYVLCAGELMIVLDTTVVNVALPSIRADLGFTEATLVWVVNAYMLTYGGFLLLGGRMGDLFGNRRLFLAGIALFTAASVACGIAGSQTFLVAARAIQGLGGAVVSAVALALIVNLFTEAEERAKAMGIYGFVCAAGGSIGVLLGGLLTDALNWHWVFLINLPIGAAVYAWTTGLLARDRGQDGKTRLDVWGAVTVTTSLVLAVYAIVNHQLGLLIAAAVLLGLFLLIEARIASPLMPLRMFRVRSLSVASVAGALWAAAMFAWFFISALYMQDLGYSAMQIGLSFLPANLIMAAFSLGWSAKLVMRFGARAPLIWGLALTAIGLALFTPAPADGRFLLHVLPGMILLGVGCGMAINPVLLVAMADVTQDEAGLASGIVNTAFMMGGALGLAVLASLAALTGGYPIAFGAGAAFAAAAALIVAFGLEKERKTVLATPS